MEDTPDTVADGSIWETLADILLWVPLKLYGLILDGLAAIIEAIPAPEWVSHAGNILQGSPGFLFWLDLFNVPEGLSIVFGAYGIRFIVRRIPVIG